MSVVVTKLGGTGRKLVPPHSFHEVLTGRRIQNESSPSCPWYEEECQMGSWSRAQVKKVPCSSPNHSCPKHECTEKVFWAGRAQGFLQSPKHIRKYCDIQRCPNSPCGSLDMEHSVRQEVKGLSINKIGTLS